MNNQGDSKTVKQTLENLLTRQFGVSAKEASREQLYRAVATIIREQLCEKRGKFKKEVNEKQKKRVYYVCMEFLLGRSLKTNLCNMGLEETYREVLKEFGADLDDLYECEPDAGLGNGGLGRLAACFMDSLSSLDYPATGFSICYEYGLFKQRIVDGTQVELPDVWLPGGDVWLTPRADRRYTVHIGGKVKEVWKEGHMEVVYEGGEEIEAMPYDMMISGADSKAVSQLRLWKAQDVTNFNMNLFSSGQYSRALENSNRADIISKVLYPADNHEEGKLLRLTQQYFLVSASMQSIIRDHMAVYRTLDNLEDKIAVHINDTHPAMCIPELMRILMDDYHLDWDTAWAKVTKIVSYTNHTVLPEALETWNEDLFRFKLPRIYQIIHEINDRFCKSAWEYFPGNWERISRMSVLCNNRVHMANLSLVGSHAVNGVSKLHSEILKESVFNDYYHMAPQNFGNVTNGIAHRRWLCYSNPALAKLLDETIGTGYRKHPEDLAKLRDFADDKSVLQALSDIKHQNKIRFANHLQKQTGIVIDPNSFYDVQIKRLHEYKRQLLNALHIIGLYLKLKENPNLDMQPQTFLFGAKAAPGYYLAKEIIKLIYMLSREINADPKIREKLQVVFLENYNVTMAEAIVPAAELSEQISLAGKEASGTGCMKLMINGALTIGTLDGANIEMREAAGDENFFIFGLDKSEVNALWARGYHSADFAMGDRELMNILHALNVGFAGTSFANLEQYLLQPHNGIADPYMCLADYDSYAKAQKRAVSLYQDKTAWNRASLYNIAGAGYFAADRSIEDYAKQIWNLERLSD